MDMRQYFHDLLEESFNETEEGGHFLPVFVAKVINHLMGATNDTDRN